MQATTAARSRRAKASPLPVPDDGRSRQLGQVARLVVEDAPPGAGGAVCVAEQAWAPGLGWYTQRTVSVPDDQLDQLIAQLHLARARRRLPLPAAGGGNVIPFRPRT